MMRNNIKKILREFIENHSESNDFMRKVDFAQEKAIEDSDYPEETKKVKKIKNKSLCKICFFTRRFN